VYLYTRVKVSLPKFSTLFMVKIRIRIRLGVMVILGCDVSFLYMQCYERMKKEKDVQQSSTDRL
jgi:hypothetical protein